MILGKVVGKLWGTRKSPELEGFKLLEIRPVKLVWRQGEQSAGQATVRVDREQLVLSDALIVAVDRLDAGIGDYVLVATGTRVRNLVFGDRVPIKSLVVGIVDEAVVEADAVAAGSSGSSA